MNEKKINILKNISVDSEVYPNIDEKIDELFRIINKYFEGVGILKEEDEKKIVEENLIHYEMSSINNSVINSEWAVVNLSKAKEN